MESLVPSIKPAKPSAILQDRFGRTVRYLRLSVTDRCDFRCVYCMAEDMQFQPRSQLLSLEEHYQLARVFVQLGTRKIRITGGEPLVRRDVLWLCERLGGLSELQELVMTTNGSQLPKYAQALVDAGVSRINISLDTLQRQRFRELTRTGELSSVLAGIKAAQQAGFARIKLNAVILKGRNEDEVLALTDFALAEGLDLTFIEEMPLGVIDEHSRALAFCSSTEVRAKIESRYALQPHTSDLQHQTQGGPARYYQIRGYDSRIGFISPHSHNFCGSCNRVRVTSEGRLLLCLGNEHSADLRALIRSRPGDDAALATAITEAMALKPEKHEFDLAAKPHILRYMSMTGG